ncbi:MAG: family 78 glycoside hydrolase catalytic domain [bacterium]|nr:family 78 glycoside hydrolase catalytic domain [bacterium]
MDTVMKIYDMKANYQVNPLGIDLDRVTLTWKIGEAEGKRQTTARVWIAEDENFEKIVSDSGKMDTCEVTYTPKNTLAAGISYYWKVNVSDELGNEAESEIARFEGGHPQEVWIGSWICPPFTREIAPVFQKSFHLEEATLQNLAKSRLYLCALGVYEVYLNGKKVGDEFLTPYFTDYRYWIQYQTYDVKDYLQVGENCLEVYVGNGWYKGVFSFMNSGQLREFYGDQFCLLADLYFTDKTGKSRVIGTDTDWLVLKSPIISSGIYDGEVYNANIKANIDCVPERQILHAEKAEAVRGSLCPMVGVGVRRKEVLPVKQIITTDIGETILDFGQEITGWVTFYAQEGSRETVHLQYSEVMQKNRFYRDNLRTAKAEYTFLPDGKRQFVRPHFTFYGFRYVKVSGMEVNESNVGDFEAWALYSDIEETGWIETSNEKVNRLIANTKWSQKDNFLDVPTDCPQRDERLGWTGDAQIFSSAASYHMQTPAFFRKYLKDMLFEQREKGGAVPYVVPDVLTVGRQKNGEAEFDVTEDLWGEAGASVWGDAAVIIPWNLYLHYGNLAWLSEQYSNMKEWMDFVICMDEQYCGGKRLWTCGFHFGDWLSLDSEGEDNREGGTDKHYVASISYYHSAQLVAKAAKALGYEEDAVYYEKIAKEVRAAMRAAYVTGKGRLRIETQTAYVLGIWFELFDEDEMQEAGKQLCLLLEKYQMHLATGFVGTAYLSLALSKTGHASEAYTLLLNEDYPSWLYEVNLGATTIWERWNSLLPDGSISSTGMNSLNHYAYGVIAEWMYRRMCGLELLEAGVGARRMHFAPQPDKRMAFAKATYRSIQGDWKAGWSWEGENLHCHLEVPFNCEAEIGLEAYSSMSLNGNMFSNEERQGLVLPAGIYDFVLSE